MQHRMYYLLEGTTSVTNVTPSFILWVTSLPWITIDLCLVSCSLPLPYSTIQWYATIPPRWDLNKKTLVFELMKLLLF